MRPAPKPVTAIVAADVSGQSAIPRPLGAALEAARGHVFPNLRAAPVAVADRGGPRHPHLGIRQFPFGDATRGLMPEVAVGVHIVRSMYV
jgi:hypothetical protein